MLPRIVGHTSQGTGEVILLQQGQHPAISLTEGLCGLQSKTVQPKPGSEEKGQIVQTESPIHHSNVMLYSKEKQIRSRVGHR